MGVCMKALLYRDMQLYKKPKYASVWPIVALTAIIMEIWLGWMYEVGGGDVMTIAMKQAMVGSVLCAMFFESIYANANLLVEDKHVGIIKILHQSGRGMNYYLLEKIMLALPPNLLFAFVYIAVGICMKLFYLSEVMYLLPTIGIAFMTSLTELSVANMLVFRLKDGTDRNVVFLGLIICGLICIGVAFVPLFGFPVWLSAAILIGVGFVAYLYTFVTYKTEYAKTISVFA